MLKPENAKPGTIYPEIGEVVDMGKFKVAHFIKVLPTRPEVVSVMVEKRYTKFNLETRLLEESDSPDGPWTPAREILKQS